MESMANAALRKTGLDNVEIRFQHELVMRNRHEAVDAAILWITPQTQLVLALICCKSNLTQLQEHCPIQGMRYLAKVMHNAYRPGAGQRKFHSILQLTYRRLLTFRGH